jgi:hypothetical protein
MALEERVPRLEGIVEQVNERLGAIDTGLRDIRAELRDLRTELRSKADKWEARVWSGLVSALLAAVLAAVLVRL